jgi:DNA uptake protein ComE-like DNA-binding protein
MSNFDYEDEDDDSTQDLGQNNDLVKQLRKANKQKEKELSELKAQFDGVSKAQRERAIKDVLEARGINKKVASFIPSDIDPTEESLSKWLTEYGDVFGITAEPAQDIVNPAQAAAYKKMNSAVDNGITPDSSDDMLKKILNTNSKEELDEVLRQSGL